MSETKFSLEKIAQFLEGELEGDPNAEVIDVSGIESTALNTITFSTDTKTLKKAKNFLATAIVLPKGSDSSICENIIYVDDPYFAFARLKKPTKENLYGETIQIENEEELLIKFEDYDKPKLILSAFGSLSKQVETKDQEFDYLNGLNVSSSDDDFSEYFDD
mgnify:CR=1 FL=1